MAISTTFTLKFAGAAVERGLARVQSAFKSLGGVAIKIGKSLVSPFAGLTALLGTGALVGGLISLVKGSSDAASSVESLTTQFTTLLGSATAAKQRMEEITKFAASTPFEIAELAATSKLLEVMGGKMISTGDGLRLVGDAAAMAGQPIEEVGLHIGRLFSAITSGTSAGESVNRLQELGLITGETKIKFEELAEAQEKSIAASGGSSEQIIKSKKTLQELSSALKISLQRQKEFTKQTSTSSRMAMTSKIEDLNLRIKEVQTNLSNMLNPNQSKGKNMILSQAQALKLLQTVMSKSEGGMNALSKTTEGKLSNMKDNITQLKVVFGEGFNIGLKNALDRVNEYLPKMMNKFKEFGLSVGKIMIQLMDSFEQGRLGQVVETAFMAGVTKAGEEMIAAMVFAGNALYDTIAERMKGSDLGKLMNIGEPFREGSKIPKLAMFTPIGQMAYLGEKAVGIQRHFTQKGGSVDTYQQTREGFRDALNSSEYARRLSETLQKKSAYLGPMGNRDFPTGDKPDNKIMLDIKKGIDGLNQKLSPQP